ncbi:MAG: hypothetical protein FJ303_22600 [Planctomycetes bacterium]|nr:hypothetical protein [Planctomycetota bacterium]
MMIQQPQKKRKGSVLVEYGLLIAGIVLVAVVAIAVLGHKVADQYGVMAGIMPGAHPEDNVPVAAANALPFKNDGGKLVLDTAALTKTDGTLDRMENILGAGSGETLVKD